MGKTIVAHIHPDLDSIAAAWLLVNFGGNEFADAEFKFTAAGTTYKNRPVDEDPDVVHVDTGGGMFDHHDPERTRLSATHLVFEHLKDKQPHLKDDEAMQELVDFVTEIDQFGEYYWPDSVNSRYAFMLSNVIKGFHAKPEYSDEKVMELGFTYLEGAYQFLKDTLHAIKEVKKGYEFSSLWGSGVVIESANDSVMKVAQKMGYDVVIRQDPDQGFLRIKAVPKDEINLRPLYNKILEFEDEERWYFHPNGHMIFNGSTANPYVKPTKLSAKQVLGMIKELGQRNDSSLND